MKLSPSQIEVATTDYSDLDFSTAAENLVTTLTHPDVFRLRIAFLEGLVEKSSKPQPTLDASAWIEKINGSDLVEAIFADADDFSMWLPLTTNIKALQEVFNACWEEIDDEEIDDEDLEVPARELPENQELVSYLRSLGKASGGTTKPMVRLAPDPIWSHTFDYSPVLKGLVGEAVDKPEDWLQLNSSRCDNRKIRIYYQKQHVPSGKVRFVISDDAGKVILSAEVELMDDGQDHYGIELPFSRFPELNAIQSKGNILVTPID